MDGIYFHANQQAIHIFYSIVYPVAHFWNFWYHIDLHSDGPRSLLSVDLVLKFEFLVDFFRVTISRVLCVYL